MAHSTRTVPILVASVIAASLVGGAFVLSGPIPFIDRVTAQSSEELLKAYAVKDSDTDGLTDWQESLYGTDPVNPNSFRSDLLDGEAAQQGLLTPKSLVTEQKLDTNDLPGADPKPDSLTEAFSKKFLAQYLLTRGSEPPSEEAMLRFVNDAVMELATEATVTPAFDRADTRTTTSDEAAYIAYADAAGRALKENAESADREDLAYFADAVNDESSNGLTELARLSKGYARVADAFVATPVPPTLRDQHLGIANALAGLSVATEDLSTLQTDPIRAMIGLAIYQRYRDDLTRSFAAMHKGFSASNFVRAEGEPGYFFFSMSREAQKAGL